MRGSFKTNETKEKRSVEPFSVALSLTSPLRLFGCLHYRALTVCFFLLSLLFVYFRLLGVESAVLFPTHSLSMLSFAAVRFLFCFVFLSLSLLWSPPLLLVRVLSLSYTLAVSVYYSSKW